MRATAALAAIPLEPVCVKWNNNNAQGPFHSCPSPAVQPTQSLVHEQKPSRMNAMYSISIYSVLRKPTVSGAGCSQLSCTSGFPPSIRYAIHDSQWPRMFARLYPRGLRTIGYMYMYVYMYLYREY